MFNFLYNRIFFLRTQAFASSYFFSVTQAFASSTVVELAKACVTEKKFSVLEKNEHSSLRKIRLNRMGNLHLQRKACVAEI